MQKRPQVIITIWRENAPGNEVGLDLDCMPCNRMVNRDIIVYKDSDIQTRFVGCNGCNRGIHGVPMERSQTVGFTYNGYDISIYEWHGYWKFVTNQEIRDVHP